MKNGVNMARVGAPVRRLADRIIALLSRQRPGPWVRYSVCVAVILACAAIRAALPIPTIPYLLFIPAVFVISLMYGAGAGLAATLISAFLAAWLFLGTPFSLRLAPGKWLITGLYVVFSSFIAVVCDAVRRSALTQDAELRRYRALEAAAAASARALGDSEARLADERSRLATLVEHLPVGVCFLDRDGRMLLSNPAYRRLDPRGEIAAPRPDEESRWIAWDREGRRVGCEDYPVARVFRGETEPGLEFLTLSETDTPLWARISGVPLRGADGEVLAALIVVADIDAQKQAQQALLRLNETLESRVLERTAQLESAQEDLRQAYKMEALGQLTGGIAHDFNNLLAAISGSLELLRTRLPPGASAEAERYIEAALGATFRAGSLTHRLLAFSRRQALAPRATDINVLVAGLEDLIRRTVGPGIEIEVAPQPDLWVTRADPHQLENALLNLCINARDAMPEGGRLTISTANQVRAPDQADAAEWPAGDYAALSVADTGTGMTPQVLARAFEPFFTTKPLGQGTGLGLSMIYGFARQSGGQVTIRTAVGEGSTVTLYLPRHDGEAAAEAPPAPGATGSVGEGRTVLVIDDEAAVRMVVVDRLTAAGYAVLEAHDGASGLAILDSNARVDLLVSDVGLPGGLDGRQVAAAARRTRRDLKVLFITGYLDAATSAPPASDAGTEALAKPFALEVLAARVHEMIGARPAD